MGFYKDRRIIMNKRIISLLLVLVMLFSSISISEENVTMPGAEPVGEETVIVNENETVTVTETPETDAQEDESVPVITDESETVSAEGETAEPDTDEIFVESDEVIPDEEPADESVTVEPAEETSDEVDEESAEEEITEPEEELTESEEETEVEPSEEEEEEEPAEDEQTEPVTEDELTEEADLSCSGDVSFTSGWVKLPYGTNLYETQTTHEAFAYTAKAGVAYAIGRVNAGADGDRMEVVYAGENGVSIVYIKSNAVYPMSADEISDYTEELEKTEETVYSYVGDVSVSLIAIPVTYWNAEETENEETENTETENEENTEITEPTEGTEPEVVEPTEETEPEVVEPTEETEVTEPAEEVESEIVEPTEETEVTEPADEVEPEIVEPAEETEVTEPAEEVEPEIVEPIKEDEPEIIEPIIEDEPEIENDPVMAMMFTLLSAPGPVYNPTAVKFDYAQLTMGVKDSADLSYTVTGAPASCVGFVVSDESVASVSASGTVTAKAAGIAVVTMVAPNGLTDSLAITVLAAPTDIKVNVDDVTVDENKTTVVTTSFTGDVYGEVYLKGNSDDTIAEAEYIGNGSFRIRGLLSGETTLTFAVDNKDNGNTYTASTHVTVNPAVVRIEVTNPRATVGYNEKVYLMPVAYDGRGNVVETAFTYATSNKSKVAIVGEQIQAKSTSGTADITITAENGANIAFTVKCVNAPGSVTLPAKTAKLAVGESVKLTATLPAGSDSAITWASNNEGIVTVSADGTVTAVSAGKAQIKAATFNGKYALCEFTVVAAPDAITFSEASYTMKEGEMLPTVILFTPGNAGGQVVYTVENTDIATISADGTITALTTGTTRLHAVVHNFVNDEDCEAYADLTVKPNVYEIRLSTARTTLGVGETLSLAPVAYDRNGDVVDTAFTYKASSTYYIKLIAPDAIKGNYAGASTITITAANGVSVVTAFKVMKAPTSIALNTTSAKLVTGQSLDLAYALPSGSDSAITWDVQPAGIVTVDENGHVEAIGAGSAVISCTTFNGKKATCSVSVTESPAEFAFKYDEYEVAEGDIIMPEMVMDIPTTNAPIVFSISYTDEMPIASVSGNSVKGGYSGYATLTATVHNVKENRDLTAETTIKVVPGVCSIKFLTDRTKIAYKETLDPMAQAYDARGNEIAANFTYKSSSTLIKVVEGGLYGNNSYSSANVTATAPNGVSAVTKFALAAAPTTVKLDKTSATLVMSQSVQLTATTNFTENLDIIWTSSDETVVKVENGLVTTIGPGTATVTASTYNGKSAACKVTVYSIAQDIAFGQSVYTVKEGAVITPDITLVPDTAFGTVTLSVEDGDEKYEIASVSGTSVKGLISGTATVTATVHEIISDTDISRTFTVNVEPAPCTVEADAEIVIGYNEITDVTAVAYDGRGNQVDASFTLKPASTYYIKVNGNQIKGSATGSTKLTISAENGVNTVVPVKVVSAPTGITLNAAALNLQAGENTQLVSILPKNTHASVTFESSDKNVAVVDANGVVTAIGLGEATITATTHNGKKATCKVKVGSAPEELIVEDITVKEGESVVPAVMLLPEGSMGKVTLTAEGGENNEFVAIEGNAVKGLASGSTTVTATVYDVARGVNVSKTINVTVETAICTIKVAESVILGYNEILDLAPVAYDGRGNVIDATFTIKPSSTYYVKVNGTEIKGTATGKATVTVTAENGVSATVAVQIVSAPGSITLNTAALNVQLGESIELIPTLPKNTHASITYTTSDDTIAVVDENGVVTGVTMGEATITAATHNGKKATCKVKVGPAPEELSVADVTVKEGASAVPTVVLLPEGSMGKVTLTAENGENNEFIAIEGNVIKGLMAGSTTVTATVYDVARGVNVSKTFNVTVDPAPYTIAVEESVILGYNEILDLAPVAYDTKGDVVETTFTLKPSSNYYLKVNGTQIKGTGTGKATVTVTAENGVSAVVSVQIISAPGSITLNATSLNVQVGESIELIPTLPKNTHASITYASSDNAVAIVDNNGVVTGTGMGEATITATTHNGKKATCKVKVGPAPEELSVEDVTVKQGMSVVPAIVLLPEGSMGKVTLTAENGEDNEFIAIEGNVIKGLVVGTTTVTATVYDVLREADVTKTFTVIVEPAPYSIEVDDIVIGYGEIVDVTPVAYDVNGNVVNTTFTLKPSSTYYVKVNGMQLKGTAGGSIKLTVTAENGVNIIVPVKVCSAPASVTLNTNALTLQNGTSAVLTATLPKNTAGAVTFTSSDETVAAVSADGTVTAVSEGSAVITATTFNGKKATCAVTVMGKAESITFERETVYIAPGSTAALKVNTFPAGSYTALTYESSNPAIVSVDAAGNIKALAAGEVTITARGYSSESMSEITAAAAVKVKGDIVRIDPGCEDTFTMGCGEILYLNPVAYDREGNIIESDYTYTTSNRYRVTTTGNMLKAAGTGTGCIITVKASNGVSTDIGITVVSAPAKVTIPATMKLSIGESGIIPVTLPDKTHATYTFTSSDPNVISVKDDGSYLVTGIGSAKVTIKTHNGKTAVCTVTVMNAPESIVFTDSEITVKEGASVPAIVTFAPEGSWSKLSYTLSGSEEELVTVDENGILTGKLSGSAVLNASAVNYLTNETITCSVPVTVLPAPRTIEFRGGRIGNSGIGEIIDLEPVALDARGNEIAATFTLKSAYSNATVVNGTTNVKLNSYGTAKITATADNGISEVVSFKISYAPSAIKLNVASCVVPVNGSVKLISEANNTPECSRTWESSVESVATVTEDGLVQAFTVGTATITVKTYNNKIAKCTVTVLPEAEDISFNHEEVIVGEGGTLTESAVLPEGTAARIVYASRNPFVATVDPATGLVTGIKAGTTSVTATIKNVTTGEHYTATYTLVVKPAPATIELLEERRTIGAGETLELKAVAYDASGEVTSGGFTYATSSKTYLSLPQEGFIKGGYTGTAKITITAYNGVSNVFTFKIVAAPTSIKLNTNAVTMSEADTYQLSYKLNSTTTTGAVTYTSDNEDVVTVDENGLVSAHDAGTATVTVRTYNGKTNTCKFTVLYEPDGIALSRNMLTLGETATYGLSCTFSEGHMGSVSYVSRNPEIASVNENGVVTANVQGETTITVTTVNRITGISYSDTCLVTVTPQPVKIVILNERDAIGYNESMKLDIVSYDASGNLLDGQFTVSSTNSNYIKVSGNEIKGLRTGSASVKIVAYNGLTYTKLIKVTSAPTSVKLNAASAKVVIGAIGFDAVATLNSTAVASAITWVSENPDIAAVDENGHISGVSAGTTRIKASTYNGKYALMTVEVYNQPESVTFEKETFDLGIGDSAVVAYSFNENAYSTVTFSCPETDIVSVDENGSITAKKSGTAHITVTTVNGKTDTVTVNVVPAPESVSFSETTVTLGIGQKLDVSDLVVLPEGTASSLKFAVESTSILTLNGSTITGKNKGTTRVKVTTYNGKTALLTVNVKYAPSAIKVALVNKVLYEGDTPEFAITLTSGTAASYTFESSDPAVLSFDANGVGHANSMGTAKVKVTTHNNVSATISVTVYKHVSGVSFADEAITLVHYDAQSLRYTVTPEIAYDTTVSFTSSNPEYVSVTGGIIEAKQVTTEPVIITVTTNDLGFTDTLAVTVTPVRVTGIELSAEAVTLEKNREVTIGATILPANADDKLIEWTSSDNSVATVDFNGKVTAVGDHGTATITAKTHDGSFVKSVTVTATKVHLKGAQAQYATYEIEHFATEQLSCIFTPEDADIASAVWTSSDESVLTVDQSGRIYGADEGKANVTCVITDTFGASFTCVTAVTITPVHVTSVELSSNEMTLRVGRGKQVDLTVYPFNADDKTVTWSVDTQNRVTITENEDGAFVIAGQTAGDVTLTVTSNDGAKTDTCLIHVLDALVVVPSSELPKTTAGNDIVFYIDVMNAIGNVSWNISIKKDDNVIKTYTAYDAENGITVTNAQNGIYTIEATVTDSENDTANGTYSVEVSDRIEYAKDGFVYSYIIAETSSGDIGAFIKLESCPAGTTSITVPSSMNEAPVVRIDTEAFMGLTTLVSVAIPASCTEIGARAFKGCTSLSGITNY